MISKAALVAAALAAIASASVHADDVDASQHAIEFQGNRTRAEVIAEAARVPTTRSTEPPGSRVAAPIRSTVDVQALRAEVAEAVRLSQVPRGEASH